MILNRPTGVVQSRISPTNSAIQQIKAAGLTSRGATTQGLPQAVRNISVTVAKSVNSRKISVAFTQNPADHYFSTAHVYIQQGTTQPTLVASGVSPVTITLPKSSIPARVFVVSAGNWGTTPLSASPGRAVSLA